MEINVLFDCSCGAAIDKNFVLANFPSPEEEDSPVAWQQFENLKCDGCSKDFDVRIFHGPYGFDADVPSAIGLLVEALPDSGATSWDILSNSDLDDEELAWAIGSTDQLEIFSKMMSNIVTLLKLPASDETRSTLNNVLYAHAVTAVEAYLSGLFIHTVVNSADLIRRLVETDPELAKRQFSLKEIFSQYEDLKTLVAKYLKDLIFHNIEKVKPMYKSVLEIDFDDVGWLFKAVLIRHDCVHRGGVDKEGVPNNIDSNDIHELIRNSVKLISKLDAQAQAIRNRTA